MEALAKRKLNADGINSETQCFNCGDEIEVHGHNILHTKTFGDIVNCDTCLSILAKIGEEARHLLS